MANTVEAIDTNSYANRFVELINGVKMPMIGYGTYKCTDENDEQIIRMALDAGYRLLDTASAYGNETQIGKAIRKSGLKREELFLTSKVWKTNLGYEKTKQSVRESLENLETDYLDLCLLHWPKPSPDELNWKELDRESWRALEELYNDGKVKSIGISNFLPQHIEPLLETATVRPMVNQLELHVGYNQEVAVQYCKQKGIQVQAWSPLGRNRVLQEPIVIAMAEKYKMSPAGFLLLYLLSQNICVIPKASSIERMRQNKQIQDIKIEDEDMYLLKSLPQLGWSGEHPDLPRVAPQERN